MQNRTKMTEAKISEMIKDGRGKGDGKEYRPWVEVSDFSSQGKCHRIAGLKTGRVHHFLSDIELNLFHLLEHSSIVCDIREQYPLKRDITLSISAEIGVKHPVYPGTKIPTVMTADFLVIFEENGEKSVRVFSCKDDADLENFRTLEKLELERKYFEQHGILYHLVVASQLPKNKVKNLKWCRGAAIDGDETFKIQDCEQEFRARIINAISKTNNKTLTEFCLFQDAAAGLEIGSSLRIIRKLIWHHDVITDLNVADLAAQPMLSFKLAPNLCAEAKRRA